MKRIKRINGYVIFEQTEKEINHNANGSTSKYLLYSPDEMEQPKGFRSTEWEADSIMELLQFIE